MKKFVHPYWHLLMHMFIMCMTENRGGTDQLNSTQSATFICLITNQPYNYSKYVFEGMKRNVTGLRKDKFVMYPRFLQMIFNARYSDLERTGNTLDLKLMGPACFGALAPKKGTEKRFEGRIALEKFGQFVETEEVVNEPVIVQPEVALVNVPVNAVIAEEHVVQAAADEEPETEIMTINSDNEGAEISCDEDDEDDEVELPPEAEVSFVVSTVQPVISAKSLALLIKSVTEKMGNSPSDPSVQSEDQTTEDPKDPDTQQVKRRRRDPRPGVFIEQSKDQPVTADEDEEGLYDFYFEEDTTATATATETGFVFEADTTRMDVDSNPTKIPVAATVSAPITESTQLVTAAVASSSGTVRDEPCSSSGKRPEEPLRMSFVDDSSDDDEFISMREMKKRIVMLEQDSIHKDVKIIQLEDTIIQKNQQIDQLQGDLGDEFSDPTDTERRRKAEEDRAWAFAKDDADRAAAMEH
ncbi:hypothetical protein HanRHA438_Chr07g0300621 [Helianthus annuus]|uniref:Uncharacterized protein n=1 Tax=Helianthus annuus TaxID=4232 RepID=A0A9K3IKR5_HELAN|nr:hypothetical protein HanXRQr2_Chr07g0290171 [Helianthus annuus]KAJ0549838.1 hypothetical protein HanHA300_Chr07g0238541 [Helianthus annuus]KAJ0556366.1 hypothetical protein HanIR_Chr07g0312971 [Helianthus annuus]KAJ0562796.1 hypothetical protein HanHA89_Chr07g0255751 [Helianthus annuus]KAJ0730940.1 hypothetical protein HanOQP8_Chr07g0246181 [Helianthus annuus]